MTQKKELTFKDALRLFTNATKNSMKYAGMCATMGLEHFAKTGDVVYLQSFLDAMPNNYMRKVAFVKWTITFSPAELVDGKFIKDKSETANEFDLEGAAEKPFWEFSPEKPITNYSANDLIVAVLKVVDRHENGKKMQPADETALATAKAIRKALANISPAGNVTDEVAAA